MESFRFHVKQSEKKKLRMPPRAFYFSLKLSAGEIELDKKMCWCEKFNAVSSFWRA